MSPTAVIGPGQFIATAIEIYMSALSMERHHTKTAVN